MHGWLAGGADPDRHIYPTLTAMAEQGYGYHAAEAAEAGSGFWLPEWGDPPPPLEG